MQRIIYLYSTDLYKSTTKYSIKHWFIYLILFVYLRKKHLRCQRTGRNHCNYQQVKCYRLCLWPPPYPFHTQRGKIPIFHLSIWSLPQDRRFPTPPPRPMPAGQRARSDLPAACYERLWVSPSDYCLGGFILYLHLYHPQMKLLFLYLHPSFSLYLFLFHHSFWNASCFSHPWCLILFAFCVVSFIRDVLLALLKGETQNPRWEMLSSSSPPLSFFTLLPTYPAVSHYIVILWLWSHGTPCFPLMSLCNKLRLDFNSFFRIIFSYCGLFCSWSSWLFKSIIMFPCLWYHLVCMAI